MAAEAKPALVMKKRPVEFRGLSTHYVIGDTICASFRYPALSFQPGSDDMVKLYRRGTRSGSLASSVVGDPLKHRLCDGGLYKTGTVSIDTSSATEVPESYVLFYGSSSLRQVVGKSEPFTICPQKDFPSIQVHSVEDIDKLRAHSPIENPATFSGAANGRADDMSFAVVSAGSSQLGEWEVLDEGEEEEEVSGAESDDWSDIGGKVKLSLSCDKSDESNTESEVESASSPLLQHQLVKSCELTELAGEGDRGAKSGEMQQTLSVNSGSHTPVADDRLEDDVQLSETPPLLVSLSDLSTNTVMLKNANKELRTKVRVLHDKLHHVSEERDSLLAVMDSVNSQVATLKQKNKKLSEQQTVLKAKYRQVQSENRVLTRHCEKQVVQVSQYETQLKAVSSENQQLHKQIHHTTKKSKHHQHHKHYHTPGKKTTPSRPAERAVRQRPVIDVYVSDPKKGTSDTKVSGPPEESGGDGECAVPGKVEHSVKGETASSLSEQHILSIMEQLKGGQQSFVCPVCMRTLHSHETEYSAQLHIEHCLLDT